MQKINYGIPEQRNLKDFHTANPGSFLPSNAVSAKRRRVCLDFAEYEKGFLVPRILPFQEQETMTDEYLTLSHIRVKMGLKRGHDRCVFHLLDYVYMLMGSWCSKQRLREPR